MRTGIATASALLATTLAAAVGCSGPPAQSPTTVSKSPDPADAGAPDAAPPLASDPGRFLAPRTAPRDPGGKVAAKIFAFADTQLHYMFGKRTFAQSPFADRMAFEVAIRPAALDDGSDLLLSTFASDYSNHYSDHALVFLGDAADLSCEIEMKAFLSVLRTSEIDELMAVASNHDGFFVGNFTSKDDLDGNLALTDMPHDWTRACSLPGSRIDRRLTKGRAVKHLAKVLPEGPLWATSSAHLGAYGPDDYDRSWLYYVRKLPGGEPGTPPVWGVFLDTVDYRGFDLKSAQGAGSNGGISRLQLRFLDRAMFQAAGESPGQSPVFVLFGHHPFATLEPASRRRLSTFIGNHPNIVAYVSAHEHAPSRHSFAAGGRTVPEYIVGSTTDSPHSASAIEVRMGPRGPFLHVVDLFFDTSMCDGVERLPPTSLGYTGYRISRDDTPDVDLGTLDKLAFVVGLSDLEEERARQVIGALLVENELVRSLAELYLRSPLTLPKSDRALLSKLVEERYAAGSRRSQLAPYLRGAAHTRRGLTSYDKWEDPVIAKVATSAAQGVHRFGPHSKLFNKLRALRSLTVPSFTYFLCHAAYAAEAEAKRRRQRGNILYIR